MHSWFLPSGMLGKDARPECTGQERGVERTGVDFDFCHKVLDVEGKKGRKSKLWYLAKRAR